MNLGLQIVLVKSPAVEWLQHFLDLFLQRLNQRRFVLNAHISSLVQVISLDRLPLPLSLKKVVEKCRVRVFRLELFDLQVYSLSQQVYVLAALDNQSHYLLYAH